MKSDKKKFKPVIDEYINRLAPYASPADEQRAMNRAHRWMRANPDSKNPPPCHIQDNYQYVTGNRAIRMAR